ILLALGIALLVNSDLRGAGIYRTIVFLSYPLMTVAVGIIWRWMYDERGGLINWALRSAHVIAKPIAFLGNFDLALPAVLLTDIYKLGFGQTRFDAAASVTVVQFMLLLVLTWLANRAAGGNAGAVERE